MREPVSRMTAIAEARQAFVAELERHGLEDYADSYSRGEFSEKQIAALMGHLATESMVDEDDSEYSMYAGIMLLAVFLHEGRHNRPCSRDALKCFWSHLERVHPGER